MYPLTPNEQHQTPKKSKDEPGRVKQTRPRIKAKPACRQGKQTAIAHFHLHAHNPNQYQTRLRFCSGRRSHTNGIIRPLALALIHAMTTSQELIHIKRKPCKDLSSAAGKSPPASQTNGQVRGCIPIPTALKPSTTGRYPTAGE